MAMNQEPCELRFIGALVEHLGSQLYPSATETVAEFISNAWDADATNVLGQDSIRSVLEYAWCD